jgi:zinc finger protein
MDFSKPIDQ